MPGDTIAIFNGVLQLAGWPAASTGTIPADHRKWIIPHRGERISLDQSSLPAWLGIVTREGHDVTPLPDGRVLVDGAPTVTYRVQQNHYFVVGDNAEESSDSRNWGLIPESALIGKGLLVYWSKDAEPPSGGRARIRWERIGTLVR
jgi:signal peptidase I